MEKPFDLEEVQKMNEVRILNGKISDAKKQVNQLYLEMGKKLYEQYKEAPFEGFETEIRTITETKRSFRWDATKKGI